VILLSSRTPLEGCSNDLLPTDDADKCQARTRKLTLEIGGTQKVCCSSYLPEEVVQRVIQRLPSVDQSSLCYGEDPIPGKSTLTSSNKSNSKRTCRFDLVPCTGPCRYPYNSEATFIVLSHTSKTACGLMATSISPYTHQHSTPHEDQERLITKNAALPSNSEQNPSPPSNERQIVLPSHTFVHSE